MFRAHWWAAVATLTRTVGDLEVAEDAVQEACAAAVAQWTATGVPAQPRAWLISVARHKARDWLRREAKRLSKEETAVREQRPSGPRAPGPVADDQLALIFMCCHPALNRESQICLTLRSVCGIPTAEIAAVFLVPEPTVAQRLVRAKRKIREAGIPFRVPPADAAGGRLGAVCRVVYLMFTQGHRATTGGDLVRPELCREAIRLARALTEFLPGEPEVVGLLALLLLVDARRPGRVDGGGRLVPLAEQDRGRWRQAEIAEGVALVERALVAGRPGPYQIQAAIAACHSTAARAGDTDWGAVAKLYEQLARYEPSPVVEANRAVAIAETSGPAAGLTVLDAIAADDRVRGWAPFHIARADMLRQLDRPSEAADAYRAALALDLPEAEQIYITDRLRQLSLGDPTVSSVG